MTLTPEQITEELEASAKSYDKAGLDGVDGADLMRQAKSLIAQQAAEIETAKMRERSYKAMLEDQDRKAALRRESLEAQVENLTSRLEAANARVQATEIERLRKALTALVKLNDEDYSPFGGELLQDRVDRAWDNARAALNGGGE